MAFTADGRITLLRIKIERAKEHIRDLKQNELLPYIDSKTGEQVARWKYLPVYPFAILCLGGHLSQNQAPDETSRTSENPSSERDSAALGRMVRPLSNSPESGFSLSAWKTTSMRLLPGSKSRNKQALEPL